MDALGRGMQLFVVDPRRSDVAKRADVHLAARPGFDADIVAAILRVILAEGLYDEAFAAEFVDGLDELRRHVEPFHAAVVAERAGIDAGDIERVARAFAGARRAYVMAGTGASMSGPGTLIEYLILNLETLCGHWMRAGDRVPNPGVLFPPRRYVAAVTPPGSAHVGEPMRVRGLTNTPAGMPTAALVDEILLPGEGQVRALISVGGNPVASFPDQLKTIEAMRSLDLLVQVDPWLSATAQLADYVIAPTMPLEMASASHMLELMSTLGTGYGSALPYAQYTPVVTERPDGSDLIEEWEFFYEVARAMGLPLEIPLGGGGGMPTADFGTGSMLRMDMNQRISTDELISALHVGSRIPLEQVKKYPHGHVFDDPPVVVEQAPPGSDARFQLADPDMMTRLDQLANPAGRVDEAAFPYRLVCRRMMHAYNSSTNFESTNHGRPYNPAFMNPAELHRLGVVEGDTVRISSARATIAGIVHPDAIVPTGLVSMAFGFGGRPEQDDDYRRMGSSTARLVSDDVDFDPYSGQPRMNNIPVSVMAVTTDSATAVVAG
jgi:anaerobic selenocysteine-containing dehydrogenase